VKIREFRNVYGSTSDPVDTWPYEGLVEVIEYGNIGDWWPILEHLNTDPWGKVARNIAHYLDYCDEKDVVAFFRLMIRKSREEAEQREREEVMRRVRATQQQSGLTSHEFAERLGTSASRFSTYLTGKVIPSAALLVRMETISTLPPPPR
jgi:DNA-binding transcriptional regulator YiaG